MDPEPIKIEPAYVWVCTQCGHENLERAVIYEFGPEDWEENKDILSREEMQTGKWISSPSVVTCGKCEMQYDTEEDAE